MAEQYPASKHILDREKFGQRLRSVRQQNGWTLADFSNRSGVSITTISRAERGMLALGYDNLALLGRALGMDMATLFSEMGEVRRKSHSPVLTKSGEGIAYHSKAQEFVLLGTSAENKSMTPILGTVESRKFNGKTDFMRHEGEEFVYVLIGTIDVYFDTEEVFRLNQGDSLYYDSQIGHAYVNVGEGEAKILAVMHSGIKEAALHAEF